MPKHQSTAAKAARAQARDGAKYTAALRAEHGDNEHGDNRHSEPGGGQPPKVTRDAARQALAGLLADPALRSPWRPVLSRLADDAAAYDAACEVARVFEECDDDESGLPVGVTERQARQRRHLALCAYGTRAVAVLRAVADHRPPGPDGVLDGEDVARDPLYGEHLLPDEDQVAIPQALLTAQPCLMCEGTQTPPERTWTASGACTSCSGRGTHRRGPELLERAWGGFAHVLAAHEDYESAFGRDDTDDCDCAETTTDGRCTCDPYYIPEHMIDEAGAIEDEMGRWPEALAHYADAIAVVLATELRGRLVEHPDAPGQS